MSMSETEIEKAVSAIRFQAIDARCKYLEIDLMLDNEPQAGIIDDNHKEELENEVAHLMYIEWFYNTLANKIEAILRKESIKNEYHDYQPGLPGNQLQDVPKNV